MSVTSWAVYRLNIDYCNELKTKMSPYGTWALMELDYAIYDGLEMILKVNKNARNIYVSTLWCKWWWWMSLLFCPLSSIFFYFDVSPHFCPQNGLERSQNVPWRFKPLWIECDGLERSQNSPWRLLSTMYISDGLESSQFCSYTQWSWNESIHHVSPKWSWKKSLMGADFFLGLDLGLSLYSIGC